jgi:hypothetical protein
MIPAKCDPANYRNCILRDSESGNSASAASESDDSASEPGDPFMDINVAPMVGFLTGGSSSLDLVCSRSYGFYFCTYVWLFYFLV